MKVAILLTLVAVASSAPADVEKRFLLDNLQDLWHNIQNTWNQAKAKAQQIAHGIDFDNIVAKLVDMIDSSYTQPLCVTTCVSGAGALGLGVAAALVEPLCDPLCHAALAFLEEQARQGK